jgi:hypothetical protein
MVQNRLDDAPTLHPLLESMTEPPSKAPPEEDLVCSIERRGSDRKAQDRAARV